MHPVFLVNIACLSAIPLDEIKESKEPVSSVILQKGLQAYGKQGRTSACGGFLRGWQCHSRYFRAAKLFCVHHIRQAHILQVRLNQEIARPGFLLFPEVLASSKPFNTPLGSLIVHYIPPLLVIVLAPLGEVYLLVPEVEGYTG